MSIGTTHLQNRQTQKRRLLAASALGLSGCLWGMGFLFGKFAMQEMTVSENVAFRFVTGALVLIPVAIRYWKPYRGKELGLLLLASVIGFPVQFLIQFQGLQLTTVSHASLIVGALPVLLALSSAIFLHERLHGLEWIALGLSAAGAVLIALSTKQTGSGPRSSLHGDFLVLISMFAAVAMILCSKRLIASHGALAITATTIMLGTAFLLVWVEVAQPLRFHFSALVLGDRRQPRVCWLRLERIYSGIGDYPTCRRRKLGCS